MNKDQDECSETEDVLLPADFQTSDGGIPFLRHTSDHRILAGVMYPCKEGKFIPGDSCFVLYPREDGLMRVEEIDFRNRGTRTIKGPAKVNNKAFLNNWGAIFDKKPTFSEA